ncbi:MAG: hypothetical protein AAGM22_12340 [Acidobacteriota bacterium]
MPVRQMIFQYALPIFVITQLTRKGLAWLRKSERWSRGLESVRLTLAGYGGHFYGMVTSLTFLRLGYRELEAMWKQAPDAWGFLASWSFARLFHFGIDSFFNLIKAAFWPLQWFKDYGSDAWLLIALAWLLYRAALLVLQPLLPEREPPEHPKFGTDADAVAEELNLHAEAVQQDLRAVEESLKSFNQELAEMSGAQAARDS